FVPDRTVRDRVDELTEREVVFGDVRPGRQRARRRSIRMISTETNDRQARDRARAFELLELRGPDLDALHVGDAQVEWRVRRVHVSVESWHGRGKLRAAALVPSGLAVRSERQVRTLRRIPHVYLRGRTDIARRIAHPGSALAEL